MIPFLHLGALTIPTFGLMVACAMLSAFFLLRADLRRRQISQDPSADAESLIAVPCLAGILGAKLYHVLETPRDFFADPVHQLFSQFGFAWFGGLLFGVTAFVLLARSIARRARVAGVHVTLMDLLDAGSPAAALGYGVGRIGCFLSGDGDYGIPTSLPWGISFPNGLVPTTQRVHPTPIYELLAACLIAWLLWRLGGRQLSSADSIFQALASGKVFAAYLILTGVARFLVEFIRINPRSFFGLSNAQAASVASVLVGVFLWWRLSSHQASRAY
ncbi:MAG: prolipoprotein diacylglyceryl transferase [Candidatus Acidiferrales bacterium]